MITDYVIIVAGGRGLRMGGEVPKQFLPVGGIPVLMRTLMRFSEYAKISACPLSIILVLPRQQHDYWLALCQQHQFRLDYQLAVGGRTRFHSVQNGLALVPDDAEGVVAVHDGVRPFVSVEVISRCFDEARRSEAAIPVVPVVETLRHITDGTKPRDDYRLVQTPQVFSAQLLKAANNQHYRENFTDDASVVEAFGHAVTLVEGNRENIKITTPFDLRTAEALALS